VFENPAARTTNTSRRDFILRAGVRFGLPPAAGYLLQDIIREPAGYFPIVPFTGIVAFHWVYCLTVAPLIFFVIGCLFGLVMWHFVKDKSGGNETASVNDL
jgi:hypothetical protein